MTVPNVADRMDTPAPGAGEGLLLHSMEVFWEAIEPLLDAVRPARLCEIGVSDGRFSARLIAYARAHDAVYTGIDPALDPAVEARLAAPEARWVRKPSLEALPGLEAADAYFIDGDHNHHTVFGELTAILAAGAPRLIVLHDTAWPWGRRDQYCDPDRIPEAARHPFTRGGYVHPDHARAREEPPGFRGVDSAYPYAAALEEGGERNGVFTAVQDICRAHPELRQVHLPALFGLSVLYPEGALPPELEARLLGARALLGPLLEHMERNRLRLFFAWTELLLHYDALRTHDARLQTQHDELHGLWRELDTKFRTLHDQYTELAAAHAELQATAAAREAAFRELRAAYDRTLSVRIARRLAAFGRRGRNKDARA
jgi:hypothetical protein